MSLEEESEKAQEGFRKMESLLEVARREQAKTAVQLQHLQQQAERDKERAVEAVELSKAQVTVLVFHYTCFYTFLTHAG